MEAEVGVGAAERVRVIDGEEEGGEEREVLTELRGD